MKLKTLCKHFELAEAQQEPVLPCQGKTWVHVGV